MACSFASPRVAPAVNGCMRTVPTDDGGFGRRRKPPARTVAREAVGSPLTGAGDSLKVVVGAWNVRHGGGRRRPRIARALSQLDADVLVLGEWSPNGSPPLRGLLEDQGWHVLEAPGEIASRCYGVALASRLPVRFGHLTATDSTRLVHGVVAVGRRELDVLGVYVPSGSPDMTRKRAFLEELAELTEHWSEQRPAVLAGDFNCDHRDATGSLSPRLVGEPRFAALFDVGWHDAHRRVADPSSPTFWEARTGVGFRLDQVLSRGPAQPVTSSITTKVDEGHLVAGPDGNNEPMSDHAAITTSFVLEHPPSSSDAPAKEATPNP